MILFRCLLNTISKAMQFSAIQFIPLALNSIITFTTGPFFGAALAFLLIGERLSRFETWCIIGGVYGILMLTMPQWFMWMGIQQTDIEARLTLDQKKYNFYYLGIFFDLAASALDVATTFIVRQLGAKISPAIIPFMSGIFSTLIAILYCTVFDPFFQSTSFDSQTYTNEQWYISVFYGILGGLFGWLAIECLILGARMSKSAIASYAEQIGFVPPFVFDFLVLKRKFLITDFIGLFILVSL